MGSRVEKYREYREEIEAEGNIEVTNKSVISEKIDSIRDKDDKSESLSFDTVMDTHKIYSKEGPEVYNPFKGRTRVSVPYLVLGGFVLITLFALCIYLSVLTFGGIK